jgi:hypothetical protein
VQHQGAAKILFFRQKYLKTDTYCATCSAQMSTFAALHKTRKAINCAPQYEKQPGFSQADHGNVNGL